jgi:hypothetical protein
MLRFRVGFSKRVCLRWVGEAVSDSSIQFIEVKINVTPLDININFMYHDININVTNK